jgi:hypothetical protein
MSSIGKTRGTKRVLLLGALAVLLWCVSAAAAGAAPGDPALTVKPAGTGSGTVTSSPSGIDCGTTCSATFPTGTPVMLTATPATDSRFAGWSGGGCHGTGTCTVILTADTTVTATFDQQETLAVAKGGSGTGTVTSAPSGISCGTTCSHAFDQGTVVTLTATASSSSRFTGWSGAGCSGTGTCKMTLSQSEALTANFVAERTLKVGHTGTGSGTVTSSPAGIACGTSCSHAYDQGTKVTLTARPAAGSRFVRWSGGGCGSKTTCVVTLTQSTVVNARWGAQATLTVTRVGSGVGIVTSEPHGIDCSTRCSAVFDVGTKVKLTAKPAHGSRFAGWSGAGCAGTQPCRLTLSQASTVTADFARIVIPPDTRITELKVRHRRHRRGRARVWFTGSGGTGLLSYRCKLDRRRFRRCRSPKLYRHLRKGRHTIRVKAVDSQGIADPTPARITFRV